MTGQHPPQLSLPRSTATLRLDQILTCWYYLSEILIEQSVNAAVSLKDFHKVENLTRAQLLHEGF